MRTIWTAGLACLAVLLCAVGQSQAQSKVRVIIIDGQNNHNWKATTPVMKKALEDSGRFSVDVATTPTQPKAPQNPEPVKPKEPAKPKVETPETIKKYEQDRKTYENNLRKYEELKKAFDGNRAALLQKYEEEKKEFARQSAVYKEGMAKFHPDLSKYDVVLSNYNGDSWSKDFQTDAGAIAQGGQNRPGDRARGQQFVRRLDGIQPDDRHGLARQDRRRPAHSGRQRQGNSHQIGRRATAPAIATPGRFRSSVRDAKHPITKGMPIEWLHASDELYDNMRGPIENVHLLATAYSKGPNGTKAHEPMIWTIAYGKGRVFHTPMGHDANAMRCIGFIATLQRGTEWAATGSVTLPLPTNFPTAAKSSTLPIPK